MKRFGQVVALLAVLALLAGLALSQASAAPAAATVQVSAIDNAFQPATISINVGDTVVWTNTGSRVHTVTANDGSFNSGNLNAGQTFQRTFNTPGTIAYHCIPHQSLGMVGTIVVQAAPAAQPTATAPAKPAPQPTATAPAKPAAPAAQPTATAPAKPAAPAAQPTATAPAKPAATAPAQPAPAAPAPAGLPRTGGLPLPLLPIGAAGLALAAGALLLRRWLK